MNKSWLVWDSGNGDIEEFDTEKYALEFANAAIDGYREQAKSEGEWTEEVEYVGVYKLVHEAVVVERGGDNENDEGDWIEYGIKERVMP